MAKRTCPYCVEPVQAEALVCRHCGRQVVGNWFARGHGFLGNKIAGVLSFVLPGLGQLVQLRIWKALKFLGLLLLAWIFVAIHPISLIGLLVVCLCAAVDAWVYSPLEQEAPGSPTEESEAPAS